MVMPWYLSNLAPFCICVDSYFCSCWRSTELDADACWYFACTVCVGFGAGGAGGAGGGGDDGGGGGGDDGGGKFVRTPCIDDCDGVGLLLSLHRLFCACGVLG